MARDIRIRECSTGVSEDIASYWEQKLPRIERLLTRFAADQRQLRLSFACGETGYTSLARLVLPTGTLLVRTDPPALEHRAAIDQLVDKLTAEIRRHKERLRHEDVHHRRRRRELIIAQLEGDIPPGELTVSDLLDEVLLRAWDEWNDRPRHAENGVGDREQSVLALGGTAHARRGPNEAYLRQISQVHLLPDASELLACLSRAGVPWAIATSGRRDSARPILELLRLDPEVPVITREEVQLLGGCQAPWGADQRVDRGRGQRVGPARRPPG
jgi:phosphoglycolate phosphatase-like HAD superfamily hydrolase